MKKFLLISILSFGFIFCKANTNVSTILVEKNKETQTVLRLPPQTEHSNTYQTCCDGSTVVTGYYWVTYDSETGQILGSGYHSTGNTCMVSCA